ncbi:MAG: hypothetical protein GWP08_19610 [Nitrospiraceae bacterium]|nr:hypothetical protein [Nitrospiraceae bacterium]
MKHVVVLRGGMGKKQRKAAMEELGAVADKDSRVILATGRYIGEGFDDAPLNGSRPGIQLAARPKTCLSTGGPSLSASEFS